MAVGEGSPVARAVSGILGLRSQDDWGNEVVEQPWLAELWRHLLDAAGIRTLLISCASLWLSLIHI